MPGAKAHKKALDHDRPFDWVQARTQQRPGKVREQEGDAKKFASFHSRSKTGHFTRDHFHRTGKLITNSTKISYALRQSAPTIRPVRSGPRIRNASRSGGMAARETRLEGSLDRGAKPIINDISTRSASADV